MAFIKTVQLPNSTEKYEIVAASADKLTSARKISATGQVEWEVSFDGSSDVSSGAVIKSVPWSALTGLTAESGTTGIMTPDQIQAAINNKIAGVYQIQGTTAFSALTDTTFSGRHNGYVYNVNGSGDLPATATVEGVAIHINAGDNVVFIGSGTNGKWDKLASTLDVSEYVTKTDLTAGTLDAYFNNISAKVNVSVSGNLTADGISGNSVTANTITGTSAKFTNVSATNVSADGISSTNVSATNISGTSAKYTNVSATNITGVNVSADKISGTEAKYTNITGTNISGTSAIYNGISANTITGTLAGYSAISNFVNTGVLSTWSALSGESANNPISQGRVFTALSSLKTEFANDLGALNYSAYSATVDGNGNLEFKYVLDTLKK